MFSKSKVIVNQFDNTCFCFPFFSLQILSVSTVLLDTVRLIMDVKNASDNFILFIPDTILSSS